jgi:hypothetical protein
MAKLIQHRPAMQTTRTPHMNHPQSRPVLLRRWLIGIAAVLVVLVLVVVFFPWDLLRGPINRHVSTSSAGVLKSRNICR